MALNRKNFSMERYDEIKAALKAAKIESYELERYIMIKDLKFLRHAAKISLNDAEILEMVNSNINKTKFDELLGKIKNDSTI